MANQKTGAVKAAPFNIEDLTKEQQEAVVEKFIGIHPKFYIYEGISIKMNVYLMAREGKNWTGFGARNA